ncbi:MAG: hypothetical protein AB1629_04900 [Candidatus Omnitrophota bacterium]
MNLFANEALIKISIFLLMNSVVLASSFLIVNNLLKNFNFVDSVISLFLFFYSQIIFSELLLGIFSQLSLLNLVFFNITIFVFLALFFKIKNTKMLCLKNLLFKDLSPSFPSNRIFYFLISIIFGFGFVKLAINLVNPPFGWDNLNYHFTFPVEWMKNLNLNTPIVISDDPASTYYPINGSLFFLWLMFPFKNVFLADLGQVPFFIVALLSVYSIGKKLNLKNEYAFFAAAIFTLIPNYFKQLEVAYVDVMVASLFLAAVNFLFLLNRDFKIRNLILFSLSLGLMLGTKSLALLYAILLIIPFFYLCFKKGLNFKKFIISLSISIVIIIVLGSFSYIRNFIEIGNPLYPLDVRLFGKLIFKGVMDAKTYSANVSLRDYSLAKILFSEGLGVQTVIFVLPAMFLGLPLAIKKRRKDLNFWLAYFLILPVILAVVYRFFIPLANLRYLYCLLAIGILIAFYIIDCTGMPKRILNTLIIICTFASIAELAKYWELIASLILSFLLFFYLRFLIKKIDFSLLKNYKLTLIICIVFLLLFSVFENDYVKNEYQRYIKMVKYSGFWPDATLAWHWLNQQTKENNIAYVGRPVPFPLYGTNFKNNVYYVSVNETEPAKLHYFKHSRYSWNSERETMHKSFEEANNYRGNADINTWLSNLERRKANYLFVYSLHQIKGIEFPIEDAWAKTHPKIFSLVFKNDTIHIYHLIK